MKARSMFQSVKCREISQVHNLCQFGALSFPKIRSARSDDVIRTRLARLRLVGKRELRGYVCPLPPATDIRSQEAKGVAPFRGTGGWDSFGVSRGHAMKLPADNFRNW